MKIPRYGWVDRTTTVTSSWMVPYQYPAMDYDSFSSSKFTDSPGVGGFKFSFLIDYVL